MARFTSQFPMQSAGGQLCGRARFWVSLRVDGELSELEGALLDAHLARCPACADFAGGATVSTQWLRDAQLERAAPVVVAVPKSPRRGIAVAAAVAVLVASVLAAGFVRGTGSTHGRTSTLKPVVSVVASSDTPDELRRLRRTSLLNERPIPREFSVEAT